VRGVRAELPPRKTEARLIVVAARYDPESHRLRTAKAYQSADQVWTDVLLFSRQELIDVLESGKKVVVGRFVDLATDFEISGQLQLVESGGETFLRADGQSAAGDDLGVPLF
jgi:hypothetical protein